MAVKVTCPNCGGTVEYRWSSSVQSVCPYCKSVLVRSDVDVKKLGEVGDLPDNSSPIQLGTEGIYRNKGFVVAGRIVYQYENGGWNEWHIVMSDGTSGWLSDAQNEYMVSFARPEKELPKEAAKRGQKFTWGGVTYEVTAQTLASYKGVEGELPFQYWDKDECMFVDLRSTRNLFATLDYSEDEPLLFVGEALDFDQLKLKNLREFEGW